MKKYGIVYQGSKTRIADDIIQILPQGKRFVDLFGGGFAMSHCALLSGKYQSVLYNEIEPLLLNLIRDAINGKYRDNTEWISREDFAKRKDTDGFVKYIWSFGCSGDSYLYSHQIEPWKKSLHYARVFGDFSLLKEFGIETTDASQINIKNHN